MRRLLSYRKVVVCFKPRPSKVSNKSDWPQDQVINIDVNERSSETMNGENA
ncbi:hypothetical protein AMTRI_Chr11g153130 [Amborella trichopoda]